MKYFYYPGCSLKGTARSYEESLLAVFEGLGIAVTELPEWNCCGATAYMSVNEMEAFALAARNLALARSEDEEPTCIIAPCNACYLALVKAQQYLRNDPAVGRSVRSALGESGLTYDDRVLVRHPLDVLLNDVGVEALGEKATRPLEGLTVACYYGCQVVRPYARFDDEYNPMSMDTLLRGLGAETIEWPLKSRCCGASLTGTVEQAGLSLSHILLTEAQKRGAGVIATCCPLCQFNLECYQGRMRRRYHDQTRMPVAYFTQLMGMAMGLEAEVLGLQRMMVPVLPALATN